MVYDGAISLGFGSLRQCSPTTMVSHRDSIPSSPRRSGMLSGGVLERILLRLWSASARLLRKVPSVAFPFGPARTLRFRPFARKNLNRFPGVLIGQNARRLLEAIVLFEPAPEMESRLTNPESPASLNPSQPIFLGREKELSFLFQCFESVSRKHGTVVLLGGEAGVGKTSLVESFASKIRSEGAIVAQGYCLAEVSIPYFPFAEALKKLATRKEEEGSTGLLKWLSGPEATSKQEVSVRDRMFDLVVEKLAEESSRNPFLLFLDDLHWADSASLALLHYIARNTRDRRILVIGTYRSEELGEVAPGKQHPLRETMRLMSREGLLQKLELTGLQSETIKQVAASLIHRASNQILELIAKESDGNPFYAVESARFLLESGTLSKGDWKKVVKTATGRVDIPVPIFDVIARRLSRLGRGEREIIDCASVVGEHFKPQVLAKALKLDLLEAIQKLARISQESKIVVDEEQGYRFDHAKTKEVAYLTLGRSLAKELHRRVAEALLETEGRRPSQELAYHYHSAGVRDKTIEFGLIAGDLAKEQFALAEAASYYKWVIEAAAEDPEYAELRGRALASKAETLSLQGLHRQAIADSEAALACSKRDSTRLLALRVSAQSWLGMGHFTEALECVKRSEAEPGEEQLERLQLKEVRAIVRGRRGDHKASESEMVEVGRVYLSLGRRNEYARVLYEIGGERELSEALALFEELGDMRGQQEAFSTLAFRHFSCGEDEKASENYEKAVSIAKKLGMFDALIWSQMYWAFTFEAAGRYDEALKQSLNALETAALSETPYPETGVNSTLVRCYLRENHLGEAEAAFERMNELYEKHGKDASLGIQGIVARTRGFRSASRGEWKEADEAYAASIELFSRFAKIWHAETLREYAECLLQQGRKENARQQLKAALALYNGLGNRAGADRTLELLKKVDER